MLHVHGKDQLLKLGISLFITPAKCLSIFLSQRMRDVRDPLIEGFFIACVRVSISLILTL